MVAAITIPSVVSVCVIEFRTMLRSHSLKNVGPRPPVLVVRDQATVVQLLQLLELCGGSRVRVRGDGTRSAALHLAHGRRIRSGHGSLQIDVGDGGSVAVRGAER